MPVGTAAAGQRMAVAVAAPADRTWLFGRLSARSRPRHVYGSPVDVAGDRQAGAVHSHVPALGRRGEGWVVLQLVLFVLIAVAAWRSVAGGGEPPLALRLAGTAMCAAGLLVLVWGASALGSFLTPFPRPTERNELVTGGPFRWVRHPIYSGVLLTALGACLLSGSG